VSDEPLQIRILSNKNGACDLHVQVVAAAVQATFDRVFHEAVARAQTDPVVRHQFKVPDDQPVDPDTVFAAWGERVHTSMQRSLVDWALLIAKDQLDLPFADEPLATVPQLEPGKPATLRLRCFLVPEIPTSALDGLDIERRETEPDDEAVETTLHQLRRAAAAMAEPDAKRSAQPGDRLVVDLRAELEGGASILDKVFIDLDLAHEPPELVEHLTGATAGTEVSFDLGGIAVNATVQAIHELPLPELDDALAKLYGLESAEKLRVFARASVRERLATDDDDRVLATVTDHICEQVEVPVPETLARRRYALELRKNLVERARLGRPRPELDHNQIEGAFKRTRPVVERLERQALVLAGLVRALGVELEDDEVHAWVRERGSRFGFGSDGIMVRPEQLGVLRRRMLQQRLVEAIRSRTTPGEGT